MVPAALLTFTVSPESCAELVSSALTSEAANTCEPSCVSASNAPDCWEACCAAVMLRCNEAVVLRASARAVSD